MVMLLGQVKICENCMHAFLCDQKLRKSQAKTAPGYPKTHYLKEVDVSGGRSL